MQRLKWGRLGVGVQNQIGFTLVELITVLIVVGILAVVVLPRFDLLRGFSETGYRDKVRATLEYARKAAISHRRAVCVASNASNGLTLTVQTTSPESGIAACGAATYTALALASPDAACGGATNQICAPKDVTLTAPATALRFDAQGNANAAATYTVTNGGAITVNAGTGYVQ